LVTLVERKSRYTLAARVDTKQAQPVAQAMVDLLRPYKSKCYTLTFDNSQEFAQHHFVSQCLAAKVYFAHPYCSWERGLNENTNRLLRQYFPKGTNLRQISQVQLDDVLYAPNHRPRKCLGYKTPHEVFFGYKIKPFKLLGCCTSCLKPPIVKSLLKVTSSGFCYATSISLNPDSVVETCKALAK
jgi:transposase, IS30 family